MWRALVAAIPLAESYLARADSAAVEGDIGQHVEAIAEIISATRNAKFAKFCQEHDLGPSSGDVANHPSMFRQALSHARRSRVLKRRV
jgi:hypothetical protein